MKSITHRQRHDRAEAVPWPSSGHIPAAIIPTTVAPVCADRVRIAPASHLLGIDGHAIHTATPSSPTVSAKASDLSLWAGEPSSPFHQWLLGTDRTIRAARTAPRTTCASSSAHRDAIAISPPGRRSSAEGGARVPLRRPLFARTLPQCPSELHTEDHRPTDQSRVCRRVPSSLSRSGTRSQRVLHTPLPTRARLP
jgi:hypothetical protein